MGSRTGTAENLDLTAASGTVGITVPTDCTVAVVMWHHWDGDSNTTMSSLTINSVAMTLDLNHDEGNPTDTNGYGVATLKNPATGSQNLAWSWSAGGARDEAGFATITYVKDVDLTDLVREAGGSAGSDGDNVEVTINSGTDDLVLSSCNTFSTPAISGTVYMNNVDGGNGTSPTLVDAAEQTAGASTTTTTMTGESWASMVSVSLKNAVTTITSSGTVSSQSAGITGQVERAITSSGSISAATAVITGNITNTPNIETITLGKAFINVI